MSARRRAIAHVALLLGVLIGACDQYARVGLLVADVERPGETATDAPDGGIEDEPQEEDDACGPPEVRVCDPVTNVGCPSALQMQCAVDLAAPDPAGYCTFFAPLPPEQVSPGFNCLNTLVTESCPPTNTCVDNECRKLCFCDSDCGPGECCVDPVGTQGFRVCGACQAPTPAPQADDALP